MTSSRSSTSVGSTGSVHPTLIVLLALWMYMTASRPTQLDHNHFVCSKQPSCKHRRHSSMFALWMFSVRGEGQTVVCLLMLMEQPFVVG